DPGIQPANVRILHCLSCGHGSPGVDTGIHESRHRGRRGRAPGIREGMAENGGNEEAGRGENGKTAWQHPGVRRGTKEKEALDSRRHPYFTGAATSSSLSREESIKFPPSG